MSQQWPATRAGSVYLILARFVFIPLPGPRRAVTQRIRAADSREVAMPEPLARPVFASGAEYAARFTDPAYWRPYVAAVCARHGLGPCAAIQAGRPGTHAVFVVDERVVVKLYSPLFG